MRTYSRIGKRIALAAGFHFDTEEGDNLIPGFLDAIIGIRQGETKSFPLIFPESWKQDNLRGVHAQFTVSYFQLCPDIVHFFLYGFPPLYACFFNAWIIHCNCQCVIGIIKCFVSNRINYSGITATLELGKLTNFAFSCPRLNAKNCFIEICQTWTTLLLINFFQGARPSMRSLFCKYYLTLIHICTHIHTHRTPYFFIQIA